MRTIGRPLYKTRGRVVGKGAHLGSKLNGIDEFKSLVDSKVADNRLTVADSTFSEAGNWATHYGGLTADISTYPGYLYLNFTAGGQAVKCINAVETGAEHGYLVAIRCKVQSGGDMMIQIGSFQSPFASPDFAYDIIPNSEFRWYWSFCHSFTSPDFKIGVLPDNNNGTKILIDEIRIQELNLADWYNLDINSQTKINTQGVFSGLKKSENDLLLINLMGDSILANPLTGTTPPISDDEGDTMRPIRLITNNIARRYYDARKYNVPQYRRLDHADWAMSNISGVADFTETNDVNNGTITAGEKYFRSIQNNAYCEITIPSGVSNCAIIYANWYQDGGVDYDDVISVSLNGGDISAYGPSILNSQTPEVGGFERTGQKIAKYTNLPTGENVIRLTKSDTTKIFDIWGAMYWNGNTMKLNNNATGGMNIFYFHQRMKYFIKHSPDLTNWIIQLPEINNCTSSLAIATQAKKLFDVINIAEVNLQNVLFMTPHPFGTDPSDGTPNYYTAYDSPATYKQRCTLDVCIIAWLRGYFIDLFRYFEIDIISKGGTLEGGEAGSYYTNDGLHLSEEGTDVFEEFLIKRIPEIPN